MIKRIWLLRDIALAYMIWIAGAIIVGAVTPDWLTLSTLLLCWVISSRIMVYNLKIKAEADLSDYLDETLLDPDVQAGLITLITNLDSIEAIRAAKKYDLRSQEWIELILSQEDADGD